MPQERTLLAAGLHLQVERVRSHATAPQWSPVYRAPGRRLVLPGSGAVQLRSGGRSLLVDSLTAFCLEGQSAYQLKPESAENRFSVVLSTTGAGDAPTAAWLLAPAALYRLRLHWRALERGQATADETAAVVARALRAARPTGAETATVARARRFLLAQAGLGGLLDAADAAHSSPFHLARLFRRHLGLSPHQYRQRLRMAMALARLEEGESDLAGLAHDLGYCSQSHLGEVFRREIGVTPAQARIALRR